MRTTRQRLEERALEKALRRVPCPEAPEDLKQRLLGAVGAESALARRRPAVWGYAVVAVLCVTAGAVWLGSQIGGTRHREVVVTAPHSTGPPPTPTAPPRSNEEVVPGDNRPKAVAVRPSTKPPHKAVRIVRALPAIPAEAESGTMTISVGRATPTTVGMAQASAVMPDGHGGWAKTEWVLVRDPRHGGARQEVTYTGSGRKRPRLTVASTSNDARKDGEGL